MKRFFGATLILSVLSLLGFALAQTRDGTSITNTATATYTNAANQSLTATSNTVTTTVLPIYRFAITPNGSDTANAGGVTPNNLNGTVGESVVFTYGLENQGNTTNNTIDLSIAQSTTDDFDFGAATIYLDGGDGIFGTADDTVVKAAGATTGSVTIPYGQSRTLFVDAPILTGTPNNSVGRLNLTGTSALGNQTDTDNWAQATVFTNATLSISKTATGNVTPGDPITYTISGANTGGTNPFAVTNVAQITPSGNFQSGILISDQIPAGLTLVPGSLAFSGTNTAVPSSTRLIFSVNGGSSWSLTLPTGGQVNAVALLVLGTPNSRIATTGNAPFQYGFTFQVTAAAGTPAGTTYNNTGRLRYDINGDSNGTDAGEDVTSAPATTTISPTGTFAVGPYTFPNGNAPTTPASTYTVTGEGYTVTRSGDTQTIATVANERQVSFRQSLQNATNFNDTFTLSSTPPAALPGSVSFYAVNLADGSRGAPITTLSVNAGLTGEFYAVVTLPADYTTTTPINFTVTATATTNTVTTTDSTTDTISAVTEAQAVNIGNYAGNGTPNDTLVNFPVQPNSTVNIPLIVRNDGADTDTFTLSPVVAPPGYTVTLYSDDNCDGIVNGTDAVVTDSGPLTAGTFECFIAQVAIPAGATPATYNVTVTATSQNDPNISDSITDTVTVELLENFSFTPTPQAKATSNTVPVVYTHTITNNSNDVASVNLSQSGGAAGFTYAYSLDGTNYVTALPQGIPVAANGGTQAVYVRVTPATGAAQGTTDTFTLTATPIYGGTAGTAASVTDTTTVDQQFFGLLNLTKTVDKASAEPGDTLTYTIVAENTGSGALTNVKVTDPLPTNTTFVSVSATTSGGLAGQRILYSTNGTSWSQTAPTTLATGGSIYVGVSTNGDNSINASDTFPGTVPNPPGAGVLTVTFTVTIN